MPEDGGKSPGTRVTGDCELLCRPGTQPGKNAFTLPAAPLAPSRLSLGIFWPRVWKTQYPFLTWTFKVFLPAWEGQGAQWSSCSVLCFTGGFLHTHHEVQWRCSPGKPALLTVLSSTWASSFFSTHTFSKRHSMFWWKLKTWETKCFEEADQLVFFTALFVQVWLVLSSNFLWLFLWGWNDMLIPMSLVKAHFCPTVFLSLLPPIHRKCVLAQNGKPLTCQFWGSITSSGVHFFSFKIYLNCTTECSC